MHMCRLWVSETFKTKLEWKRTVSEMSEGDSDFDEAQNMFDTWKDNHSHAKKRLEELEMRATPLIIDSTDTDTD